MDFATRERAEFLLRTIDMVLDDAESNIDPDSSYVDFEPGNLAVAELRKLIEDN